MKKKTFLIAILSLSLLATACATVPDMTEEQEEMISEYAASLMLKYDSENHSRLVDTSDFRLTYETKKRLYDEAESLYYSAIEEEENKRREENALQEQINQDNSEASEGQTLDIDDLLANEPSGEKNDGLGGATVIDTRTVASVLNAGDFSIEYAANNLVDAYPEEADAFSLVVNSTMGNDLLVLYFNVTNNGTEAKELNLAAINPVFKLSVNGDSYHSVMHCLLEDDLSEYVGSFSSGETKRLVLMTEVAEGTVISDLSLRVSVANDSITTTLK